MIKLKHDLRNQLSNMVMTVSELRHIGNTDPEYHDFLLSTLETCCRNIDSLLTDKNR